MQKDLTLREQTIFNLLIKGLSPKEVANNLNISERTVSFHRSNIYSKLEVHSVQELLVKYHSAGQLTIAVSHAEHETALSVKIKNKKLKRLMPFGILIFSASILFSWWFLIKPSGLIKNGEVTLPDEKAFIARTFDTVYLRADRWVDEYNKNHFGESYHSMSGIKLIDFYPSDIDILLPIGTKRKIRISGTVDVEIHNAKIDIQHRYKDLSKDVISWLGGTNLENTITIGPGTFSEEIEIDRTVNTFDVSKLPPGEVEIQLLDILLDVMLENSGNADIWSFDTGRRIPNNIPNGTIMATINNLKIEPVY
ncbi:MAG: LuxR C-terminal-related transcriptional regulator [Treponema sp.]|jgi:DNA-binding CsgD family transcriptional regulator|nr:LuxR C-terminal-related transcriptional regulator [Treponema sp.]